MAERSPRDPQDPLDEEAAWAQIVAGYGEEPAWDDARREVCGENAGGEQPGGARTGPPATPDTERPATGRPAAERSGPAAPASGAPDEDGAPEDTADAGPKPPPAPAAPRSPGSFVVYAPGVGPRDWNAAEPSDDDFDASDEGHFTPPEPPPLPQADVTTKFAWIAVLGGPLLLILMVLLQQPVTWWITVLGIGGFLGGFATLVARMKSDDEDDDGPAPGSGAVV
ncbi:hypothetical protein ACGH2B_21490 [Streptomyces sp. BBFR2]|uniref:hypothetical protein n=1 Tax=Streptomyces sp. BBFR2 TaxID=3372854 RepID=UPI0037DA198E